MNLLKKIDNYMGFFNEGTNIKDIKPGDTLKIPNGKIKITEISLKNIFSSKPEIWISYDAEIIIDGKKHSSKEKNELSQFKFIHSNLDI